MEDKYLALVTAVIVLISVLVGLIEKFGMPFSLVKVIKCKGQADQLLMSDKHSLFSDEIVLRWCMSNTRVKITRFSASITSNITGIDIRDGDLKVGKLTGKGIHSNGLVYIIYKSRLTDTGEKWKGVLCFSCPPVGNLRGFWLAGHAELPGFFAMGKFDLERL